MMKTYGSFGVNLRRCREAAGMSQPDLARAVGVSREAVSQWETGDTVPRTGRIEQIAAALNVDPAALLGGSVSPATHAASVGGDVPVIACQRSGAAGTLVLGDQVAGAPRLPRVASARDVFAVYMPSDALAPWRQVGELVYFDPHRPARRGDRVLVELTGEGRAAVIGELEEPSRAGAVRVKTYNPPAVHQYEASKVGRIIRAIEWSELMSAA